MTTLAGKRALVTGASSGIGRACARALAAAGAEVVLAARRADRLQALAAELPGSEPLVLDVRDAAAVQAALGGQRYDVLVLAAGLALGLAPVAGGGVPDWREMMETNVLGVLHVLRAALGPMQAAGRGDVVIIGSVAGRQVYPSGNVYCASKHAVRALYESLRLDLAGTGVRVATVDPAMVETEFSVVRYHGDEARAAATYRGMTPLSPEDVADAILWLLTRPQHVNVGEVVLWPTDQASTTRVERRASGAAAPPPGR